MSQKRKTNSEKSPQLPHKDGASQASLTSGCWVNIFDPTIGELVGSCGYDYAMLDMEHSPVSLDSTLSMIRAVQSGGAKAVVRVPDKQPVWVGRLMDMGADAVMVPMVNTVEEAQILAKSAVYAPAGTRGMAAGIVRATGFGIGTDAYLSNYRKNFMLLIQIESREAVQAAAELAAVDGIDGIFIGPYDLAGSLGHLGQPEHKETRTAIRQVLKAVKPTGKPVSTLTNPSRNTRKLFAEGYELVFSGTDLGMIRSAFQADVASNRKMMG
ncbi:MAG: 4-hydroxy-2-oxoheptanedioate aldolase [Halioglobus sp.]|jgi:4-hydroxy-2-oxoheptanedioate aldolase